MQFIHNIETKGLTDLCKIMNEEKSDKGNGWHNYTKVYDELFKSIRHQPIILFEMGLGTNNGSIPSNMGPNGRPGASLYGWSRYFTHPDTICWGADIDKNIKINQGKICTFYCDQCDPVMLDELWNNNHIVNKMFDIIVDDGLHRHHANMCMLNNSFHKLKSDGYYIVEDIQKTELHLFKSEIDTIKKVHDVASIDLIEIPNTRNKLDNNLLIIRKN